METCLVCGQDNKIPVGWEPVPSDGDETGWTVLQRCPDCETWSEDVFSQQACDRYDVLLDERMEQLFESLHRLESERMQEEAEAFVGALHADLVLPEDF